VCVCVWGWLIFIDVWACVYGEVAGKVPTVSLKSLGVNGGGRGKQGFLRKPCLPKQNARGRS